MAYTEIKKKKDTKYFYRVKSVRNGQKVDKKRVYLGINLNKEELLTAEREADKELLLLSTLITDEERKKLEKVKQDYLKQPKVTEENRYESFVSIFTYDSTNIEGNTFTLQETSQLLFENITPRKSLREINEVVNHKKAFDFILDNKNEISKELILDLHKIVCQNTLKKELNNEIGKYRTLQVYIRGTKWLPPKPSEVPKKIASLLRWHSINKEKLHPLVLSAYFHSAFETIHPFVDGNGRVGRILMNLILREHNYPMINIPNKKKYKYYQCLEESQVKGNLRPLVKFLFDLLNEEKIRF